MDLTRDLCSPKKEGQKTPLQMQIKDEAKFQDRSEETGLTTYKK
jgi:hypothetical protein